MMKIIHRVNRVNSVEQATFMCQRGITLTEVLLVLLLVSVGMMATARFQGELLLAGADSKARTRALALAQNQLELLRMHHAGAADGARLAVAGVNADYDLSWQVSALAGEVSHYQAEVSWQDPKQRTQQIRLATLFYADPLSGSAVQSDSLRAAAACVLFCPPVP